MENFTIIQSIISIYRFIFLFKWQYGVYGCIISGNNFAAKQSTRLYSSELKCRTVLVQGVHLILTHGSKNTHGQCVSYTLVNSIDLLAKLVKRNISPQPMQTSRQLGYSSCNSEINGFTSRLRNSWEEGWGNKQYPPCKRNQYAITLFRFEGHHES